MSWKKYPENKPEKSGYYFTVHYVIEEDKNYYKALWWNEVEYRWCWRIEPRVIAFIPESRNDYYIPCVQWVTDNKMEPYNENGESSTQS